MNWRMSNVVHSASGNTQWLFVLSQGRMTDGRNDHSIAVARVVLMVGHAKGGGGGGGGYNIREPCISFYK